MGDIYTVAKRETRGKFSQARWRRLPVAAVPSDMLVLCMSRLLVHLSYRVMPGIHGR